MVGLTCEPREVTERFVLDMDVGTLEDLRTGLAGRIRTFEQRFESTNGRRPTRYEMNPLAEEVHALLVVSAELKRRERLRPARRGSDAVPMLAFDGLQNASLTVAMTTAAGGGAAAAPARGQGGALPAATAAPSTCGTLATTPLSATLELAVYGLQLFSLTHLLLINGLASLEQRGALDPKAAGLHWLEPFRVWMAWTAVLTLDTGAASTMYPELSILQLISWSSRHFVVTIGLPLVLALLTVLLIKDVLSVAWLLLLTASILATILVVAARDLLGAQLANPVYAVSLAQTDLVLYAGLGGIACCIVTYATKTVLRLRLQNADLIEALEGARAAGFEIIERKQRSAAAAADAPAAQPSRARYGLLTPGSSPDSTPEASPLTSRRAARSLESARGPEAMRAPSSAEQEEYEIALQDALERTSAEPPTLVEQVRAALLAVLLGAGAIMSAFRLASPGLFGLAPFSAVVGISLLVCCVVLGACVTTSTILSSFREGRRLMERVSHTFRSYYIGFLLIVLQMLYVPVTRSLFEVWNCRANTCAAGWWYPVPSPQVLSTALVPRLEQAATQCEACPFYPRGDLLHAAAALGRQSFVSLATDLDTRANCPLRDALCPRATSMRLVISPDLNCETVVWPFMGVASAIMLAVFTLGVPFIYGFLIREHARRYAALPADPLADADDQWAWRVQLARSNKARNLYADFEFKWRYYKLFVLIQKLSLVAVLIYAADFPIFAASAFTGINAIFLAINSILRPYLDPRPDYLAIAISLVSTFNPLCTLLVFVGVALPGYMAAVVALINVCIPIGFLCIGYFVHRIERSRKDTRKARRTQRASAEMLSERGRTGGSGAFKAWDPNAEYLRLARVRVDRGINEYTMRFLVNFFAIVTVACCIAGSVVVLGWFAQAVTAPVVPPFTSTSVNAATTEPCVIQSSVSKLEFLEYGSWDEFRTHCCCMPRSYGAGEQPVVELWACDNGRFKERVRRDATVAGSTVSPVRSFCGTSFLRRDALTGVPYGDSNASPAYSASEKRMGYEYGGIIYYDFW